MAIQVRRGLHINFDPNKLLAGEFAVSTDRQVLHVAFAPGVVKRLSTYEDMKTDIDQATAEIVSDLTAGVNQAKTNAIAATNQANSARDNANASALLAQQKAQEAQSIIDSAAPIINTNLQASYADKATELTGTFITCPNADDGLIDIINIDAPSIQAETRVGKNKLPKTKQTATTINGITFTPNADGSITVNGTATAQTDFNLFGTYSSTTEVFKLNADIYTLKGTGSNGVRLFVGSTSNTLFNAGATSNSNTLSQTVSIVFALIRVDNGLTVNNLVVYPQLEQGNTSTSYETYIPDSPSTEYPSPIIIPNNFDIISVTDNLFDYSSMANTVTFNGITYTKVQNGGIRIQGTATEFSFISFPIYLPPGTYSKRNNGNATYGTTVGTNLRDKSNVLIDSSLNDVTITTTKSIHYLRVFVNAGVSIDDTIYITINKGNVGKLYSQYKSNRITIPYELGDLPDGTKNTLTVTENGYKYTKQFDKAIFDGSADESWVKQSTGIEGRYRFSIAVTGKKSSGSKNTLRCNRLETVDYDLTNPPTKPSISGHSSANTINIFGVMFDGMTVEQFKSWLSTHHVDVHYPLTEPVITNVSNIKPLALKSYKGVSHLMTNSDSPVNLTTSFKSELWSRDYLQDKAISEGFTADKIIQTDAVNDANKVPSSAVTYAHGQKIATVEGLLNGHSIQTDVPANAKFTDTVYNHPATHPYSMITGAPTSLPANGGNADTVDSFHITKSNADPTTLANNVICFVLED